MNTTVKIESRNHKYANTYSGRISASDFDFMTMVSSAEKILSAMRLDHACKKQTVQMPRQKQRTIYQKLIKLQEELKS